MSTHDICFWEAILMCIHNICLYKNCRKLFLNSHQINTLLVCFMEKTKYLSYLMTKPTKWHVRPSETQISLRIRPISSESSLSTWRKLGSLATHWAHSEGSNQTGRMPRLIWVFDGCTATLLVLSWGVSFLKQQLFLTVRPERIFCFTW